MIEMKAKIRRWGNSFGIVVPLKAVEDEGVRDGDEVKIFMKRAKGNVLRETFGTLKSRKTTKKIMKEIDEDLYFG